MLEKIVSGGQTGVDRGALDAALAVDFPCGGWCPELRKSEDGRIAESYPLIELSGGGYRRRTLKNVQDSDGTVILYFGSLVGGTKLTRDFCIREQKPCIVLDALEVSAQESIDRLCGFTEEAAVRVLNVAGPRASGWTSGHQFAFTVVEGLIASHLAKTKA